MIFPVPMRLECAVLACSGGMVPETNLRQPAQINWWNRLLISLGRFFRWSVGSNLRARPPVQAELASAQNRGGGGCDGGERAYHGLACGRGGCIGIFGSRRRLCGSSNYPCVSGGE